MTLFGTDGIRGKANQHPVTEGFAFELGKAVVALADSETPKIIIGRDTRSSGKALQTALAKGIIDSGGEALLLGVVPSNAVSFAVMNEKAACGIMISASHNPPDENGFKFFGSSGFKFSDDEQEKLEAILASKSFRAAGAGPKERSLESYGAYKEFLVSSGNLQGLKVGIDCGNGSASFIAAEVFEKLDASVTVIGNHPDGSNINESGAMHPEQLQKIVKENKLDAGIAFDGDADRLVVIDEQGNVVDSDAVMAAIAVNLEEKGRLSNNAIVVTDYSNSGLDDSLGKHDIKVVRVNTGDKLVAEEMFANNYSFGGESSGHYIFSEFARSADALLAAIQILGFGKKLSEFSGIIAKYPQVFVNVAVKEKKPLESIPDVMEKIKEAGEQGRVFVRYSGTENVLRIMVEGKGSINELAGRIADAVKAEVGK
ncbi:phosphoglucosamine mutase [Candidatus Woesearchaeota archaeon]|nr:phosphoglucosamine mutase [Candidatus Woesearchaeota archaeon]